MKTLKLLAVLFVSSIVLSSCEDNPVTPTPPPPPAITEWAGVYTTETQWWGGYYSPLVVTSEGKVFISEHEIQFAFDSTTYKLTFDWHDIRNQRAKGSITFSKKVDGRLLFGGSINPRAQDGPVGYAGFVN